MHLLACSLKVYYVSKHINNFDGISAHEVQFCTLQILDDGKENYMEYIERTKTSVVNFTVVKNSNSTIQFLSDSKTSENCETALTSQFGPWIHRGCGCCCCCLCYRCLCRCCCFPRCFCSCCHCPFGRKPDDDSSTNEMHHIHSEKIFITAYNIHSWIERFMKPHTSVKEN